MASPDPLGIAHQPPGGAPAPAKVAGWLYAWLAIGLLALRALWTRLSLWVDCGRSPNMHGFTIPPWSLVAVNVLAGVRSTVTLLAALSPPRVRADGSQIPGTALVILCATEVALLTLILVSAALPIVIRRLPASLTDD